MIYLSNSFIKILIYVCYYLLRGKHNGVVMKKEIIKDKGFQLIVRLFKTAIKDGEIDRDEARVLQTTESNILSLLDYVEKAWDDGKIDEIEKACILKLLKKIQSDAENIAFFDKKLTDEEAELLSIIDSMMHEFRKDNES